MWSLFPLLFLLSLMFVSFCFDDTISRSVLRCFLALLFFVPALIHSCVDLAAHVLPVLFCPVLLLGNAGSEEPGCM